MPINKIRAPRNRRRTALASALAVIAALAVPGGLTASPAEAATGVAITVNSTTGLGQVASNAIGLNTAVYDGNMNNAAAPGLIKAAGIDALRYPGGGYSDGYNWETNTVTGGYDAPNTSFTDFMGTAQATGASPIITTNYGTGTAALAAAWVQNADVTNNYNIKYWEVGNEVYGNGTYGANWETDSHCTTAASGGAVTIGSEPSQTYNCGPSTYASGVLSYMSAMKAADPNIHVCAVLTTPGFWPDGVTNSTTSPLPWNQTVLSALGSKTDCVIVHYYPAYSGMTTAQMLATTTDISGIVTSLKSEISQYAGVNPANVPIMVTESDNTIDQDTMPAALFSADMYMSWLEDGALNVDWWDQHNGPGTPSTVDGAQDYGDGGMFSSGTNGSGVTEPPLDTPFDSYYGVQMLTKLAAPGDEMVSSTSGNALVRVHAVRKANGTLTVLIDNEDPTNSYTASLSYSGFTPSGTTTTYTLANNATAITSATQSSASSVTVAPYTLTVLQIPGSGGTVAAAPSAPGQPAVSNLSSTTASNTSGTATLTWPAATAGTYPVAKYQVYRLGASGSSTLVASPTATTLNLSGLTIGQSYSYDVVAVDTQGNASIPSSPATFTVPPPAGASCAVHFAISNSWPGGFGASIVLTNNSTTAINGWTLTFTWPDAGEGIGSGWNGNWTQSGQTVTVTNASWNGAIAANGGTVSIGFNGTDTGQDGAPAAFSINGGICSNN
ncbi:cellulose binding domain-containing protein [Actinospica robiniae]|uniref:cellulose binding domain-containing protein n=1 Tax=Actinospica robiniae TaxID=304901 RepID=UPI00040129F0|nr:cellulose binding domain-containing protein [Actinospica robiniae]